MIEAYEKMVYEKYTKFLMDEITEKQFIDY